MRRLHLLASRACFSGALLSYQFPQARLLESPHLDALDSLQVFREGDFAAWTRQERQPAYRNATVSSEMACLLPVGVAWVSPCVPVSCMFEPKSSRSLPSIFPRPYRSYSMFMVSSTETRPFSFWSKIMNWTKLKNLLGSRPVASDMFRRNMRQNSSQSTHPSRFSSTSQIMSCSSRCRRLRGAHA